MDCNEILSVGELKDAPEQEVDNNMIWGVALLSHFEGGLRFIFLSACDTMWNINHFLFYALLEIIEAPDVTC